MNSPFKWEIALVAALWCAIGLVCAAKYAPIRPERIPGMKAAWAQCKATDEQKRECKDRVGKFIRDYRAWLRDAKSCTTAQQAARHRFISAKQLLAGSGFCNSGCTFQPVAEVASSYLASHLGVATDYKLDEPFPNYPSRTAREQWDVVFANLEAGLSESCP